MSISDTVPSVLVKSDILGYLRTMGEEISFASDNHYGVHPQVLEALLKANHGPAPAYGADSITARAVEKVQSILGSQAQIYFVFTGTAANVLGLQALTRPHQAILCTACAHLTTDEGGAPEAITGCKVFSFPHRDGKWSPESLEIAQAFLLENAAKAPHRSEPKVLSLTQATELGTVYSVAEIRNIVAFAQRNNLYVHMDGARISNAAAALGVGLKEMTEGIDVLSLGGTKNGLMAAEAVVFLRPELGDSFAYLRKQAMQLPSKMRFLSAQFDAYFTDDLWLQGARHANAMAQRLEQVLRPITAVKISRKVETNAVFAVLPASLIPVLQKHTLFHEWDPSVHEVRLMTSFQTTPEEVDAFGRELQRLLQNETPIRTKEGI